MSVRDAPKTLDSKAAKSLVDAKAIHGATVLGQPGGWAVLVRYGGLERAIAAQRSGSLRLWRHLDTAAAFVRQELGLSRFEVDAIGHDPDAFKRRRPDAADRQRRAHEAAEHDRWFRAEIEKTLSGLADGTIATVPQEDHEARWRKRRTELLSRAGRAE